MKKIVKLSMAMGFIGLSAASLPLFAQPPAPLKRARLLSEAREPVRIVCFGDSITGIYYHSGGRRAWPEMLKVALNRLYPQADVTVINAGVSGHSSGQGLGRIEKDVLARKPHLVVVMFGMNDLAYGAVAPEKEAAIKTTFAGRLKAIVEKCRAAGAEVILCTQNPVYPEALPHRPPERIGEFAGLIRQTGAELKVPVADIYTEWETLRKTDVRSWRLLMSETVHPSMAGHKRMAERVAGTISGRTVSLAGVTAEQPVCETVIARLKDGAPVVLAATEALAPLVAAAVSNRFPKASFTVTPLPVKANTPAAFANGCRGVRSLAPALVFLSPPPELLASDNEEAFVRQISWAVNWSLPFAGSPWTAVGVDPALACPGLTRQQLEGSERVREIVRGHDLDWISQPPGASIKLQDALDQWFDRQTGKGQ